MLAQILFRYGWLTGLRGLFWIAFGVCILARPAPSLLLLARPGIGIAALLAMTATCAIAFGVILLVLAFRARGFEERLERTLTGTICG